VIPSSAWAELLKLLTAVHRLREVIERKREDDVGDRDDQCKCENDALSGVPGRLGCPPPAT
jgi:hypothetical protein